MKIRPILLGMLTVGCLFTTTSPTQAAAFMKLGDIKGEATDTEHTDWIDIGAVQWSVSRPVDPATGRVAGLPRPMPVVSIKELDKSSPKLMEAIVMGTVIPLVEIELTRNVGSTGGRVTYYKYELTNVMITSYQTGGADAGDRPIEDFSLNFEQIKVIYTEYTTDGQAAGKVEATWKVEEGVN